MNPESFYSNGKLLLTGEYIVLDEALSLALPTKFGQSLKVELINENKIIWESLDEKNLLWFEKTFELIEAVFPFIYEYSSYINEENRLSDESKTLLKILFTANQMNKSFLGKFVDTERGIKVTTRLNFPRDWGLGTSSTLINNIANWAHVDAFKLLSKTFGGSGYDIACAQHDSAITYQLKADKPMVNEVNFNPSFKQHLFFVYLNKKQNSREGIAHYKANASNCSNEIKAINELTLKIIDCQNLKEFQKLIESHEQIISKIIGQTPVKQLLFSDFKGSIKSLGAWGGDFVMVASEENPSTYFKSKGFDTILTYDELIK